MVDELCEYGCGNVAKYKLKNGKKICSQFHTQCPINRKINSDGGLGKKHIYTPESRKSLSEKISKLRQDSNSKYNTKEYIEKQVISGKKARQKNLKYLESKEFIDKIRKGVSEAWTDERRKEHSERMSGENNFMFGKTHTEEVKKIISKAVSGAWDNEEYRKEQTQIRKDHFKNPEYLKKYRAGMTAKPNKAEKRLMLILDGINICKYEFVGDFSLWIEGKNPDFINKEQKKIIELFGVYFHNEAATGMLEAEHEKERIDHFKRCGYDCLIIWDNELLDEKILVKKILKFHVNKV